MFGSVRVRFGSGPILLDGAEFGSVRNRFGSAQVNIFSVPIRFSSVQVNCILIRMRFDSKTVRFPSSGSVLKLPESHCYKALLRGSLRAPYEAPIRTFCKVPRRAL